MPNSTQPGSEPLPPRVSVTDLSIDAAKVARRVILVCVSFELLFVALDYFVTFSRLVEEDTIRDLCNITREDSLASWFSASQTLLSAMTLWLVWAVARKSGATKGTRTGWLVMAAFFTYMSVDDGAVIHERLGTAFEDHVSEVGEAIFDAYASYAWQVVFGPFFAAMGIFVFVFLWRQLRGRTRFVLVAALACLVFAVYLDYVEGLDEEHPMNLYSWITARWDFSEYSLRRFDEDAYDTLRHFSKSVEETSEMLGNTLLWSLFIGQLARITGGLRFRFLDRAVPPPSEPRS